MRLPSRRTTLGALLAFLTLGTTAAVAPPPTQDRPVTAIIVRHAERATSDPTDPPLDSIGRVRAAALAEAIGASGVSAIYVTQYRRTRETAEPAARALGITLRELRASSPVGAHAAEVARTLMEQHRGEVVLVVGHSNTIGPIARALGAKVPENLEDHEYEQLYIVTTDGTSPVRFVSARFGPPNPTPR